MTHRIKHPENWSFLHELHAFLWQRFPVDRFEFIASPGARAPEYSGTRFSAEAEAAGAAEDDYRVRFFEVVDRSVKEFVRDHVVDEDEIPACPECGGEGCGACMGTGLTAEDCDFAGLARSRRMGMSGSRV